MKRIWTIPVLFTLLLAGTWLAFGQSAPIIGALPFTLTNGTVADANQVMANFNYIVSQTNSNAANAGANSNITSLTGLTTPVSPSQGGSSVYYGGTSTNTGNAYTVSSPTPLGFTLTAGRIIIFIASATNTGSATLNVNATGVTNFYKQGASGPVVMSGGEIINGATVAAVYDGTQFQCTNCTAPSLVPTGTTVDFSGPIVPTGWLRTDGSAQLRATFPALFATLSITTSATTASSTSVTVPSSTAFQVGWYVGGSNVTCNSYITAIPDGTHITINAAAGASGATTLTIGPYRQGDCSSTFNLPNYNGAFLAGVDNTGTRITATFCPANPTSLGDKVAAPNTGCGSQWQALSTANMAPYTPSYSIAPTVTYTNSGYNVSGGGTTIVGATGSSPSGVAFTYNGGTFNSNGGTSAQFSILPPISMTYKIIKT